MWQLLAASSTASALTGLPVSPFASYKATVNTIQQTIRCQLDNITSLLRTHQKPLLAMRIKSKLSTAGWKMALLASAYFFSFSALGHCLLLVVVPLICWTCSFLLAVSSAWGHIFTKLSPSDIQTSAHMWPLQWGPPWAFQLKPSSPSHYLCISQKYLLHNVQHSHY